MTDQDTIWRYVPAADHAVPSGPSADTLRGFRRLWKTAFASVRRAREAEGGPRDRSRPPRELLAGALPEVDPEAMSRALASALEEQPELEPGGHRARVVVGPPGTRVGAVLAALARRRDWSVLAPPARAELLDGLEAVDDRLLAASEPSRALVIPELHRWLLRSARALPPLRRLLERLRAPAAPVLVGCDSWAWSFLKRTAGGDLLGEPLALAALDGSALAAWLGPPLRSRGLVCRSVEKRSEVILGAPPDRQPETDGDPPAPSAFMVELAAAARGNPATARELWTRCLSVADASRDAADEEGNAAESTLWAAPLQASETVISPRLEAVHRFVLHAVLLHGAVEDGGLERDLLSEVLPFPRHDLLRRVCDLVDEGLLEERGGALSVVPAAYPEVRGYLKGEGFLIDDF